VTRAGQEPAVAPPAGAPPAVLEAPPAPDEAIDAAGRPLLGIYRGTLRRVNLERWASPWQRALRFKRWQYVVVASEELIAGAAVASLGYVGLCFVVAWDRVRKLWYEGEALTPLAAGIRIHGDPGNSRLEYAGRRGCVSMATASGITRVTARVETATGPVEADWTIRSGPEVVEPLTCVTRLVPSGLNVTHKAAGLPVEGTIRLSGTEHAIAPDRAVALLDWTHGFPAYRTSWRWAMGAGRAPDGRAVGFNACAGYTDADAGLTENCVWCDGRLRRIGPVRFVVPRAATGEKWRIRSEDGSLDLAFEPEAVRAADENFLVVASRYRQPVGRFSGWLPVGPAGRMEVWSITGVAEDHAARW
jgi:hypothetical protein